MSARLRTWLAVLLAIHGCKHRSSSNGSTDAGKTSPAYPSLQRAGAFDLVSADTGAVLVFAEHAQLRMTLLDLAGKTQKTEILYRSVAGLASANRPRQPSLEIEEVAAATLGTRLGVVWIERDRSATRALGLSSSLAKPSAPRPVPIADVQQPIATPRGNLALVSADGHFEAFARATATPCAEQTQRDCVGYSFFQLDSGGPQRAGSPLAVPAPCTRNAVSFAVSGARRYYGVCSVDSGDPVTTFFTIQNEPSYYARADRVLEGCLPSGTVAVEGDLIVAGSCAGVSRAVRLRGGDRAPEEVRIDRLDAVCQSGKPVIVQRGSAGLQLPLNGRQDRLEAFLPEHFRLPQARAVWTGRTLLVVGLVDSQITLKGYQCDSTLLREVALE